MLLATDALSIERTYGSYILSSCDVSKSQLAELSYMEGSAQLLLKFAQAYDEHVGHELNERIYNTTTQTNELRAMIMPDDFGELCNNLTEQQRTALTVKWADSIQAYILRVDELRESHVIACILEVLTPSLHITD